MNEETTLPSEVPTVPAAEPVTESAQTEASETVDGALTEEVIYEDLSGAATEETIAMTTEPVISVEFIETVGSDIVHADLFGSFLICGTLIGLGLFRGRYGS